MQPPDIPRDAGGEPVFSAPWEAQAFAMAVAAHARGLFTWGEWAKALGDEIAEHGGEGGAYEHWLGALEHLVVAKGMASQVELEAMQRSWERAAEATPHGMPIMPGP